MSFSREIKDQMIRFAKEQSQHYLEDAEITYMEKLRTENRSYKKQGYGET